MSFREYELVIPFYGKFEITAGPATKSILEDGPNLVDPRAVAEATISMKEVKKLHRILGEIIEYGSLSELALYIRDPNKKIDRPKNLFDFKEAKNDADLDEEKSIDIDIEALAKMLLKSKAEK